MVLRGLSIGWHNALDLTLRPASTRILQKSIWKNEDEIYAKKKDLLCLHIGHSPFEDSCWIQVRRQCYHDDEDQSTGCARHFDSRAHKPYEMNGRISQALDSISCGSVKEFQGYCIQREHSSPGNLQVGQVPSNWTRQMPQTSSSGISQRQDATAFHSLIVTFILENWESDGSRNDAKAKGEA